MELSDGSQIAHYRVVGKLGSGDGAGVRRRRYQAQASSGAEGLAVGDGSGCRIPASIRARGGNHRGARPSQHRDDLLHRGVGWSALSHHAGARRPHPRRDNSERRDEHRGLLPDCDSVEPGGSGSSRERRDPPGSEAGQRRDRGQWSCNGVGLRCRQGRNGAGGGRLGGGRRHAHVSGPRRRRPDHRHRRLHCRRSRRRAWWWIRAPTSSRWASCSARC